MFLGFFGRVRVARLLIAPVACMLVRVIASCSSDDSGGESAVAYDAGSIGVVTDSSEPSVDAGASAPTLFRFAHLSPGLGPVDICVRVGASDAFTGPLFGLIDAGTSATDPGATDASAITVASSGIDFPHLTPYVLAPNASDFEIAVVDGTTGSCSTPLARSRITIDPGKKLTIAITGDFMADLDASNALALSAFVDDDEAVPDASRSRFIHAALGGHQGNAYGPLSVAAQTAELVPLAAEVDPAHASTSSGAPPIVDALGYHTGDLFDEGSLELTQITDASVLPPAWISAPTSLALGAGSVRTGFIVSDTQGLAVLWCDDNSDASDCNVIR
jgi:hypothetical protein